MSGPRRLAVFLSVVWTTLLLFVWTSEGQRYTQEWLTALAVGLGLVWGLVWVVEGFRKR